MWLTETEVKSVPALKKMLLPLVGRKFGKLILASVGDPEATIEPLTVTKLGKLNVVPILALSTTILPPTVTRAGKVSVAVGADASSS